jgi:hypothetical protein
MSTPLLWPYPDNRERNELIMIGLRHPIIDAKIQARRSLRPGISVGLLRLIIFLFGLELIVGAAVFWWWS